jgi:Flp pilus assembly protein TadG
VLLLGQGNNKMFLGLLRRFTKDRAANVAIIFALASVPMVFLTGMGIDYTFAADRQSQLNAAAERRRR